MVPGFVLRRFQLQVQDPKSSERPKFHFISFHFISFHFISFLFFRSSPDQSYRAHSVRKPRNVRNGPSIIPLPVGCQRGGNSISNMHYDAEEVQDEHKRQGSNGHYPSYQVELAKARLSTTALDVKDILPDDPR